MSVPLYSRMTVTSKNEIRYEGTLVAVNAESATLTLAQVQAFGTEGRSPGAEIPASQAIYPSIIFRGVDIKELKVLAAPTMPMFPTPSPTIQPLATQQQQQSQPPVQTQQPVKPQPAPATQQAPAASSSSLPPYSYGSQSSSQQPQVSRMSKLFPSEDSANNTNKVTGEKATTATSNGATSMTNQRPAAQTQPNTIPKPSVESKQQSGKDVTESKPAAAEPAKKSVFDDPTSRETAVITVEGLGPEMNGSDIRELFGELSDEIVSTRLLALPNGKNAADVVFSSSEIARKAEDSFDHDGLTIRRMEGAKDFGRAGRGRGGPRRFGGESRRGGSDGPPQLFSGGRGGGFRSGPPRASDAWANNGGGSHRKPFGNDNSQWSSEGQTDSKPTNRPSKPRSHRAPPVKIGDDFDFSASNAKFEREEFVPLEKAKSFFDDITLSADVDSQNKHREDRRKNAQTFGPIAYTYRGSGSSRGRGRGGRGRGRGDYHGRPNTRTTGEGNADKTPADS